MTEDLMKESMNALKEFAKHKYSYENMIDNRKYENFIFFGNLYSETLDKKLSKLPPAEPVALVRHKWLATNCGKPRSNASHRNF